MNIFITDACPEKSADSLCLRHQIKMPVESGGMMAFAFPEDSTPIPNKRAHRHYKHPQSIWARESEDNFIFLALHALRQIKNYGTNYKRKHAYSDHIEWMANNYNKYISFPKTGLTPFARCFGPFKQKLDLEIPDTIKAYIEFYHLDKAGFAKWPSLDSIPDWWREKSDIFVDKNFKDGKYTKR